MSRMMGDYHERLCEKFQGKIRICLLAVKTLCKNFVTFVQNFIVNLVFSRLCT